MNIIVISFVGSAVFMFLLFVVGFWIFCRLNQPRKTLTDKQRADLMIRQFERNLRKKEGETNR